MKQIRKIEVSIAFCENEKGYAVFLFCTYAQSKEIKNAI
jgi:hypothetical protein